MISGRTVLAVFVSLLLVLTLTGANVAAGLDRGPLDAEHVKGTMAEADAYPVVQDAIAEAVEQEFDAPDDIPIEVNFGEYVESVVTEEYLQTQVERNIDGVYAYLHGDAEQLEIAVETEPLTTNLEATIAEDLATRDPGELGIAELEELTASPASFEEARDRFRSQLRGRLLAAYGIDPDNGYGNELLASLNESPASYEATRQDYRDELRAEIAAETGVDPSNHFGSDRLAQLVESPESYRTVRQEFREAQYARIQDGTSRTLNDSELESAYQEQLPEIRDGVRAQARADLIPDELPGELEPPMEGLVELTVDAHTDDELTHQAFTAEYDAVRDEIDAAVADLVEQAIQDRSEAMIAETLPPDAPESVAAPLEDIGDLVARAMLEDELTYAEFTESYQARQAELNAAIDAEIVATAEEDRDRIDEVIEEEFGGFDLPAEFSESESRIIDLAVEAVFTEMTYEEFMAELEALQATLADDVAAYVVAEFGPEFEDEYDLTDDAIDEEMRSDLAEVRSAITIIDWLSIGLPLLALGWIGLAYVGTRSATITGLVAGIPSVLVGAGFFGAISYGLGELPELLRSSDLDDPSHIETLHAVVGSLLDPLATQSLALGVLGGGLVVGSIVWSRIGGASDPAPPEEAGAAGAGRGSVEDAPADDDRTDAGADPDADPDETDLESDEPEADETVATETDDEPTE